jgi:hypothetical protein
MWKLKVEEPWIASASIAQFPRPIWQEPRAARNVCCAMTVRPQPHRVANQREVTHHRMSRDAQLHQQLGRNHCARGSREGR